MTKKDLVRLIREVVKREVKTQVNTLLTEMEVKNNSKISINESIEQPVEDFPTIKQFTSADARAGFAPLQNGFGNTPPQQTDINGKPVDLKQLDPSLSKALTRDYSSLVKKMVK